MKKSLGVILISLLFLVFPGEMLAASIELIESPSITTFTPNDEITFKIKLSITAPDTTSYYLRGVFYKKGTSNYCGYTWNGSTFFSGPYSTNDGWKQFPKVTIAESQWQGEIRAKIDGEDSGCQQSGEYGFKIQRFTESGSGNFDNQEEKVFTFVIPTPTPTQAPTSTPTPTTKVTKSPTPTKSQETSLPKSSPSPTQLRNISSTPSATIKKDYVLGVSQTVSRAPTVTKTKKENKESSIGIVFIAFGSALLASFCGILIYKKYIKEKQKRRDLI